MNYTLNAFTLIRQIQTELSRATKSPSQTKKFKQFQMNFEAVSKDFKNMLELYQKKNEKLTSQDFQDSEFR